MNAAFIVFDGMTTLDFIGVYDPLTRLRSMGFLPQFSWEVCALSAVVRDDHGLEMSVTRVGKSLVDFDLVIVAGGYSTRSLIKDQSFLDWLRTAQSVPLKASVCTGSLLLGAAGFLTGRTATTHHSALNLLDPFCSRVVTDRIVDDGDVITAGGVSASLDLGLHLVDRLAGREARNTIAQQMEYSPR